MKYVSIHFISLFFILSFNAGIKNKCYKPANYTKANKDTLSTRINSIIDSTLKSNNISGLAIAIIQYDKPLILRGFGVKKRGIVEKIDPNAIFQIGSTTKMFTGIIINNLIEEGKITLEAPILKYLPDSLDVNVKKKLKDITIKDLLHHKSGIPTWGLNNGRIDGDPMIGGYNEEDLINDLETLQLEFEPGARFGYSNSGYALLGYICQRVTGELYDVLIKKYISNVYNLDNTIMYPDSSQKKQIATPYRKDNRNIETKPWDMGLLSPAGGLYSTVIDLSKLMSQQIKSYNTFYRDGEYHSLVLTKHISPFYSNNYYGFGLIFSTLKDDLKYEHGGDLDGYACEYAFSPQRGLGIVILTTSGGRWVHKLQEDIYSYLINLK